MLKSLTILFAIFCATWGQENKIMLHLSPPLVTELRKCAEDCGREHGVDPKELRTITSTTLPNDKPHKEFLYCIFFTSKYVVEDGHFNMEKSLMLTPLNGTIEEVKHILEDCNKITRENYLETVYEMSICFHRYFKPILEKPNAS